MAGSHFRPVVTGLGWMGAGAGSIDSALREVVASARRTLIVLAYRISDGALELIELVRGRLRAGVQVTMIVNTLSTHHGVIPGVLRELVRQYGDLFLLHEFCGRPGAELHAKAVIADHRKALLGSANLSWSGLVTNYELAVILEGDDVEKLAATAYRLLQSNEVRRVRPELDSIRPEETD